MKGTFVRDLTPEKDVLDFFLVHQKDMRFNKTGEGYLSLVLGDRTGTVDARIWDKLEQVPNFSVDDVVWVKAAVQVHRQKTQLTIRELRPVSEQEVALADYFPRSERDPEDMFRDLRILVAGMTDPHLKALLEAVLGDPDIAARFKRAPAAKSMHHAFLGGLLEHVLSLCRLANLVAGHYPQVRRDLLLAGCVLHDIGKIHELSYDRAVRYTTTGQLLGHTHIGLEIMSEKIRGLAGFPGEWKILLEHMIISHHGEYEFGAAKLPMFPEAVLLHLIDNMDAKMEAMRASLASSDPASAGEWTARCAALERSLLRTDRFLTRGKEEE